MCLKAAFSAVSAVNEYTIREGSMPVHIDSSIPHHVSIRSVGDRLFISGAIFRSPAATAVPNDAKDQRTRSADSCKGEED